MNECEHKTYKIWAQSRDTITAICNECKAWLYFRLDDVEEYEE